PGQGVFQAGGGLAAGRALIGCGLAAWSSRPESRVAALLTLTGFAWFCGTFAGSDIAAVTALGAAMLTFHRGVLFHAIVTYPGGRLSGGWLTVAVVALGYAYAVVVPVAQDNVATIVMVSLVLAATGVGYLRAAVPAWYGHRGSLPHPQPPCPQRGGRWASDWLSDYRGTHGGREVDSPAVNVLLRYARCPTLRQWQNRLSDSHRSRSIRVEGYGPLLH